MVQTGGQGLARVADTVAVAGLDQVESDMMAKVEEIIEKLTGKSSSLHAELAAEKRAHATALMDTTSLQRDKKKAAKEKEELARLLAAERASGMIAWWWNISRRTS